jgi:hypothetical protein
MVSSDAYKRRTRRCLDLWLVNSHEKGGFYHDVRYPDLRSVVDHDDSLLKTGLTDGEKADLIGYLRTR